MGGARILVVDDDPDLLHLIGLRLSSAGYAVSQAASGEEALRQFEAEQPQAVITDLRMDGMDGHALFARLHEAAPSVPVIILTAHGTIPDAVVATQRGAFGFLTKPFDGQELLERGLCEHDVVVDERRRCGRPATTGSGARPSSRAAWPWTSCCARRGAPPMKAARF